MVYFILEIMFSVSDLCNTVCNNIISQFIISFIAQLNSVAMFSRWALMVLMWDSLMYCHISLLRYFILSTIGQTG